MRPTLVLAVVTALSSASLADARVLSTQEEALAEAFPDADVRRVAVVLTDEQEARVEDLANARVDTSLAVRYEAWRDERLVGVAWFDAHVVRTLPEVLMIVTRPSGEVERVEVLAFREPPEYQAGERWLEQFEGKGLEQDLRLKQGVRAISGATLTSRAAAAAVRRALALHEVLAVGAASGGRGEAP